jgi:hypothetical protein
MHGLVNRSVQRFVSDTYGTAQWDAVTRLAGLDFTELEAMLTYDQSYTPALLDAIATLLHRSRASVMEDIGTYLVTHPDFEAVRRLLRFGGMDFADFLHSLDDLRDRARLAVPDLDLPALELHAYSDEQYRLYCYSDLTGYGHLMMGVLRVMADDYGALALLDHQGLRDGAETVSITLVAANFAQGRSFELGRSLG